MIIANLVSGQNNAIARKYIKNTKVFGLYFKNYIKTTKHLIIYDSTYMVEKIVNNTIPRIYTLSKGSYVLKENKVLLLNKKGKKYRVLKVKKDYLFHNILWGIIKEEYY